MKGAKLRIATGFKPLLNVNPGDTPDPANKDAEDLLGEGKTRTDRIVLGIQDTLIAYVELNNAQYGNIRTNLEDDWELVVTVGGQRSVSDGRKYFPKGSRNTILQHKDAIAENEYGDLKDESLVLTTFIEDGAGNLAASASIDGDAEDAAICTTAVLVDGIKPSLASREAGTGVAELKVGGKVIRDGLAADKDTEGDTLIVAPLGGDTISGGAPARDVDLPADLNPVAFDLNEPLAQLKVSLKSRLADRPEVVLEVKSGTSDGSVPSMESPQGTGKVLDYSFPGLTAGNKVTVDLSKMIAAGPADDIGANDTFAIYKDRAGDAVGTFAVTRKEEYKGALLADGKTDYVLRLYGDRHRRE